MKYATRKTFAVTAAALILSTSLVACGDDRANVSVDIFGWVDDGSEAGRFVEGLPDFPGAQEMRVRVTEPATGQVIEEQTVPIADRGASLAELQGGDGLRMDFEVHGVNGAVASGATPVFDFDGDSSTHRGFRVMISAVDAFAPVGSVLRISGQDTLVQSTFDGRQLDSSALGRVGHTAYPTSSGEILVVGGARVSGAYETAKHPSITEVFSDIQLFDPASGYFTELAGKRDALDAGVAGQDRLEEGRAFHTVTPLGGDRFLVVGGYRQVGEAFRATRSVELIDLNASPGSRVRSVPTLELDTGRAMHTATRREDGTVVVAGGIGNSSSEVRNTVEILDPSQNTSQGGITMSDARVGHTAVLLHDGATVWLIGGHDGSSVLGSTDTVSGTTAQPGPALNRERYGASAVPLGPNNNNMVAIIGGFTSLSTGATGNFELGNPLGGSTLLTGSSWSIGQARGDAYAYRLPQSGDIMVVGGYDPSRNIVTQAERLTVNRDSIPPLGSVPSQGEMYQARGGFAAAPVSNGRIILVGGDDGGAPEYNNAEYFNPYDPVR